jgi:hypothetical protein
MGGAIGTGVLRFAQMTAKQTTTAKQATAKTDNSKGQKQIPFGDDNPMRQRQEQTKAVSLRSMPTHAR